MARGARTARRGARVGRRGDLPDRVSGRRDRGGGATDRSAGAVMAGDPAADDRTGREPGLRRDVHRRGRERQPVPDRLAILLWCRDRPRWRPTGADPLLKRRRRRCGSFASSGRRYVTSTGPLVRAASAYRGMAVLLEEQGRSKRIAAARAPSRLPPDREDRDRRSGSASRSASWMPSRNRAHARVSEVLDRVLLPLSAPCRSRRSQRGRFRVAGGRRGERTRGRWPRPRASRCRSSVRVRGWAS